MKPPKPLSAVPGPVNLVFADGFLGAGIGPSDWPCLQPQPDPVGQHNPLNTEPSIGGKPMGEIDGATLLISARVRSSPEKLEADVHTAVFEIAIQMELGAEIMELQCFSPAYPNPPYLMR